MVNIKILYICAREKIYAMQPLQRVTSGCTADTTHSFESSGDGDWISLCLQVAIPATVTCLCYPQITGIFPT